MSSEYYTRVLTIITDLRDSIFGLFTSISTSEKPNIPSYLFLNVIEGLILLLQFLLLSRCNQVAYGSFYRLCQIDIKGKEPDELIPFPLPCVTFIDENNKYHISNMMINLPVKVLGSARVFFNDPLLEGPIKSNVNRKKNIGKVGMSNEVIKHYRDDPLLAGFMDKNHKNEHTHRILSLIKITVGESDINEFIEIGCANGYLLNKLSVLYPDKLFTGLDFHVPDNNSKENIHYISGYPLDYFGGGYGSVMVFAKSTFLCFLPDELKTYLDRFTESGVKQIIIEEPFWGGHIQILDDKIHSAHMEDDCWFHNYAGYFREAGYEIDFFEVIDYPTPSRVDTKRILIRGSLYND